MSDLGQKRTLSRLVHIRFVPEAEIGWLLFYFFDIAGLLAFVERLRVKFGARLLSCTNGHLGVRPTS